MTKIIARVFAWILALTFAAVVLFFIGAAIIATGVIASPDQPARGKDSYCFPSKVCRIA